MNTKPRRSRELIGVFLADVSRLPKFDREECEELALQAHRHLSECDGNLTEAILANRRLQEESPEQRLRDARALADEHGLDRLDGEKLRRRLWLLVRNDPMSMLERFVSLQAAEAFHRYCLAHVRLLLFFMKALPRAERAEYLGAGCIGLIHGLARYQPMIGGTVSTYVKFWIVNGMLHTRNEESIGYGVRLPPHFIGQIRDLRRVQHEIRASGQEPGIQELAEAMELDQRTIRNILRYTPVGQRRLQETLPLGTESVKYEDEGYQGLEISIEEMIQDEETPSPDIVLGIKDDLGRLRDGMLEVLDGFESFILAMRFGLDGGDEHTWRAIGEAIGYSKEHARQVQNHALRKLRRFLETRTQAAHLGGPMPDLFPLLTR